MEPLAVSIAEAARLVGLRKYTVRQYVQKGLIHAVWVGRRVLVPLTSLERLVEKGVPGRPARSRTQAESAVTDSQAKGDVESPPRSTP